MLGTWIWWTALFVLFLGPFILLGMALGASPDGHFDPLFWIGVAVCVVTLLGIWAYGQQFRGGRTPARSDASAVHDWFIFLGFGVVAPILTWVFVIDFLGLFLDLKNPKGAVNAVGVTICAVVWFVGSCLWFILSAYVLSFLYGPPHPEGGLTKRPDAWDAQRTATLKAEPPSRVVLYRRHHAFAEGRTSRLSLIARLGLKQGFSFWLLSPSLTAGCLFVALWLGTDLFGVGSGTPSVGLFFAGAAVIFTAAMVFKFLERARFVRESRLLTGTVTEVAPDSIQYSFVPPGGQVVDGAEELPYELRTPVPARGDQLTVLYAQGRGHQVM